jgi:hypothetical protein
MARIKQRKSSPFADRSYPASTPAWLRSPVVLGELGLLVLLLAGGIALILANI